MNQEVLDMLNDFEGPINSLHDMMFKEGVFKVETVKENLNESRKWGIAEEKARLKSQLATFDNLDVMLQILTNVDKVVQPDTPRVKALLKKCEECDVHKRKLYRIIDEFV